MITNKKDYEQITKHRSNNPRTLKKEQDEEQRTKHILLKRYNDNFEHRKQEQRASTNNTRTHNKKQAKHNEQCQAYESLQSQ